MVAVPAVLDGRQATRLAEDAGEVALGREDYLRCAYAVTPVCAVEQMYNLTDRSQEAMFGVFDELSIDMVVHCSLAKGLLTGAYAKGAAFEAGDYRAYMVNDESIDRTAELDVVAREGPRRPPRLRDERGPRRRRSVSLVQAGGPREGD